MNLTNADEKSSLIYQWRKREWKSFDKRLHTIFFLNNDVHVYTINNKHCNIP